MASGSEFSASQNGDKFHITQQARTRVAIVQPWVKPRPDRTGDGATGAGDNPKRTADAALAEALGLAEAINLNVVYHDIFTLARPRPATLLGAGKVDELQTLIATEDIGLVIVNGMLSPVQQRNLERVWDVKVLDRTGLILEIFGDRARTKEGRLQVDMAHLTYQKSRLVRSWTHLERQRGALGFVGGPGETQIESDRRQIQTRINKLAKQLEKVRRTRDLHRQARTKVPYPIIALVGYTNAGKSTLFNALTEAEVRAEDLLFATLDPTMRALDLPHGIKIILSDTVGFISDLPTDLVAAFRATLEEVQHADIIVHVRDISHQDTQAQAHDVADVLTKLGIDEVRLDDVIEVWNKIDLVDEEARNLLTAQAERHLDVIMVSALNGQGLDVLLDVVETRMSAKSSWLRLRLKAEQGADIHWLYENCEVLGREDEEDGQILLELRVPVEKITHIERRFSQNIVTPMSGAAQ